MDQKTGCTETSAGQQVEQEAQAHSSPESLSSRVEGLQFATFSRVNFWTNLLGMNPRVRVFTTGGS